MTASASTTTKPLCRARACCAARIAPTSQGRLAIPTEHSGRWSARGAAEADSWAARDRLLVRELCGKVTAVARANCQRASAVGRTESSRVRRRRSRSESSAVCVIAPVGDCHNECSSSPRVQEPGVCIVERDVEVAWRARSQHASRRRRVRECSFGIAPALPASKPR